jgi:AAA+ superfamily predicted ATPase
MTGFRANFIGVTMYDETKMRRMNVEELVKYAEPEPSDPQEKFVMELEIALCPQQERIDALESVTVSLPIQVECELDLLNAQMNNWEIQ